MQRDLVDHHLAEAPAADPEFLQTVRRAALGKVRAIEEMAAAATTDEMKRLLDAFRRAELPMVSLCDKRIYGKKKSRRSKK